MRAVEPLIQAGRLRIVPGQPQFSYPIHVVYSADLDDALIGPALSGLRTVGEERVVVLPDAALA